MSGNAPYVLSVIPSRKVIRSVADGDFTKNDVLNNIKDVLNKTKSFNGKWGFMPNITKMAPVLDPEVSEALVKMHEDFEKAGCVGIAFIVEKAVAIKAQAKRHEREAEVSSMLVDYFSSEESALDWFKTLNV